MTKSTRPRRSAPAIDRVLAIMARLRAPDGCPWDREQDHQTLRYHAVEEVYELLDAIEARDDAGMLEELGDLLLQIVFHAQLARERGSFDFDAICRTLEEKLVRRHPHVFGQAQARTSKAVWIQWDRIKKAEKAGTRHARESVFDGIPSHLPALLRAEKLIRKARKAGLVKRRSRGGRQASREKIARDLFRNVSEAEARGWSLEFLLRSEAARQERRWRRAERRISKTT